MLSNNVEQIDGMMKTGFYKILRLMQNERDDNGYGMAVAGKAPKGVIILKKSSKRCADV